MKLNNHPYHLVNYKPWPITGSTGAMTLTSGMILWFHMNSFHLYYMGTVILLLTMIQWWRDIARESTFQWKHTSTVTTGLKWGMILFIISEILFFTSFFWGFFHSSLAPTIEIGSTWPPNSIMTFDPMQIPLLNTMILLCSGITVTWTHHSLMESNHSKTTQALTFTAILGMYFTLLQALEYYESSFSISDGIYGSCFFMATGFHGIHVMIGTIFLCVCLLRHTFGHFSNEPSPM